MKSKEELVKALKTATKRNFSMVIISFLFMVSMTLLSVHQIMSMFITHDFFDASWIYVQLFAVIMLVLYITTLVYLIKKDPSKTYVNVAFEDIIEAISKIDLNRVSDYLELITLMSYKVRDIRNDSNKSRDEYDKLIAREWYKKTKAKKPANHMKGYKQLSHDLFKILNNHINDQKDSQLQKELESLFLSESKAFQDKNSISIKKIVSSWLFNNMLILANYAALILVFSGFLTTLFGKTPADTYLYALSSFLLIFSTIVNDYNSRMKKLAEWTE